MNLAENASIPVTPCAGAVIVDDEGRLLVVQRRNEPSRHCWSVPGGRIETSESAAGAARREVFEETGLVVHIGALLGTTEQRYVDGSGQQRLLSITDFAATVSGGELRAGDDAMDARWMTLAQLGAVKLTPDLLVVLAEFGVALR